MKWPLVARSAFDLSEEERHRLVAQNEKLTDELVRITRAANGLREVGPSKGAPKPVVLPTEITDLIARYGSAANQRLATARAHQMLREGASKERVIAELEQDVGE